MQRRATKRAATALTSAVVVATVGVAAATGALVARVTEQPDRLDRHPRSLSVVAVGDWLSENRVNDAAAGHASPGVRYDHEPLLRPIAEMIGAADLAICHMETPIGAPGDPAGFRGRTPYGRTLIAAPHEIAADLARVGFDRCSTASNHSYDLGDDGIATTLDALAAAGLGADGTARSAEEAVPDVFSVDQVMVSHVSYALNSNTAWPPDPWRLRRIRDASTVVADVAAARRSGAEIVIVSLHVYVEMQSVPAAADRALVESIVAGAPVDLVVVHGPHAVQALEQIGGVPVFWSLGNFVSGMGTPGRGRYSDARTLDGLAAAVRFTERSDGTFGADATPVGLCQMIDSRVVYHGRSAVDDESLPTSVRSQIGACLARSNSVVAGLE